MQDTVLDRTLKGVVSMPPSSDGGRRSLWIRNRAIVMRTYYDAEADVLAIWISEQSTEVDSIDPLPGVTITLDERGNPMMVEILDASRRYGPDALQAVSLDRLVSLAEAGRLYGLAPAYLRNLAERGRLKAKKVGRNWLTTPGWVEDCLHSRHNGKRLPDSSQAAKTEHTDV